MRCLKRSRKLLIAVFAFWFLPAAALAQEAPAELRLPSLRIDAGAAVPTGDWLPRLHGAGPSVAAGLDVPISERLDVTVNASYTRLLLNEDRMTRIFDTAAGTVGAGELTFDVSGGANHLLAGTAALKWTFATPGRAALYLSGGPGLYYSDIGDPDVEVRDADGNPVEGEASLSSSQEGIHFRFDLGAGVRLPLAAGADLFVEPHYALAPGSQYFTARAGLAFDGLFDAPAPVRRRSAPAPRRYEVSAGYRGTFFGDGDEVGAAYRAEVARRLFSSRTGLALAGAFRRAVDTDLQENLLDWKKRYGVAADLAFFVDVLQFETGAARHRLRVGAGPAVRHQWGEEPLISRDVPSGTDVRYDDENYDHVHSASADGRTRYVFTDEFDETHFGYALKLEYALSVGRVTVGPSASFWNYVKGQPTFSYGVQVGVPFGGLFE